MSPEGSGKQEKNRAEEFTLAGAFQPSTELAFLIGFLASGGYVRPSHTFVAVDSSSPSITESFKSLCEDLFKINVYVRPDKRGFDRITFYGKGIVTRLGDLRRDQWTRTVVEKHSWIFENERYRWGFIEGLFERKGETNINHRPYGIEFLTTSVSNANFICEALARAGVERPLIHRVSTYPEGVAGVWVTNLRDVKLIARNIHSRIPEKEEGLKFFRERELQKNRSEAKATDQSVLEEWRMLKKLLGHIPTMAEIASMKKAGLTKYSPGTYALHYGKTSENKSGRSFPLASENLEKIIFTKEINQFLSDYEEQKGIQIRYIPKVHRVWSAEEEVKKRLDELLSSSY